MIAFAVVLSVMGIWSFINSLISIFKEVIVFELFASLVDIEPFFGLRFIGAVIEISPIALYIAFCVGLWSPLNAA